MFVSVTRNTSKSQNDACVLHGVVRIIKLCTDCADILSLCKHKHFLKAVVIQYLDIIVEKKYILALCVIYAEVVYCRVVENACPGNDIEIFVLLFYLFIIFKGFFFGAVIFNDYHFKILIRGFFIK